MEFFFIDLIYSEYLIICFGDSQMFYMINFDVISFFVWLMGEIIFFIVVQDIGCYILIVIINECLSVVDIVMVSYGNYCFFVEFCEVIVLDIFLFNQDGVNDEFCLFYVNECVFFGFFCLEVFNCWGQQVFVSEDFIIGWCGNYRNKLVSVDVYIWQLQYLYVGVLVFIKCSGQLMLVW